MIRVVSTGLNAPTKQRCLDSVAKQRGVELDWCHHYIEASLVDPPRATLRNLHDAITDCPPTDIIVWLDGDDWLAHDYVLASVEAMYRDPGVWCTYGSYEFADGRRGHAAPYTLAEWQNLRRAPWKGSHLRTFRARLFHLIDPSREFMMMGEWLMRCEDLAIMWPILEMAGPEHTAFCPEVLCVYNLADSFEWNATKDALDNEKNRRATLEAMTPYRRLETL